MTTTTLQVNGLTCGNCVRHVTEGLTTLDGVSEVAVELVAGGTSTVTVTSQAPLDTQAVREAVDEAGYELVDS
ncbi:MAG: heavy-metal-associated domain-containing protein [Kineosporiaceae bacterium]|nr:heavy-metal-associated domain-containing protein [Kineosporiaceae bacterium]MBK7621957.1 heavy-metal-associated domain-containing protein [Kineosporiaceae bacterium]MBK8074271.1 heavy-metal-associated domain-containing protein [Kineosporiaceae bacterium]